VSALGFVLVSLDLAFKLVGVVVCNLVCLGERMVECKVEITAKSNFQKGGMGFDQKWRVKVGF